MASFDDLLVNNPAEEQSGMIPKEDYAAKKKSERDEIFTLADNTAMDAASDGERFRQYLDVQSAFSRYSAVNTLLILAQKPNSTRLADFEHWKSQGCFVKPGQSAISIAEPHEYKKEDGTPGIGYNIKKVFDISQVDARKLKPTPPKNFTERQILAALISKAPMKITGVTELSNGGGAMTDPETGEMFVLKSMGFYDTFRCVAHEMASAEINHDINIDPQFTAYCASYMLSKKYGVDTKDYNFGSAPSQFADMDAQEVKKELSKIRDVTNTIADRMTKHLDAVSKAVKKQEPR